MANKEQFRGVVSAKRLKKEAQLAIDGARSEILLERAREYVTEYEEKVGRDLPEAEEAINQVILPWWKGMEQILSEIEKPSFLVWSPSEYLYPHHAYESLDKMVALSNWSVEPSVWTGNFWIEERQGKPSLIAKRVVRNGGFSFAMMKKRFEIEVLDGDSLGIHKIYPRTILELAKAIETGEIWEKLIKDQEELEEAE